MLQSVSVDARRFAEQSCDTIRSQVSVKGLQQRRNMRREGLATGTSHFRTKGGCKVKWHKVDITERPGFDINVLRLREIEFVIRYRHGNVVPDPSGTDDRETCLDYARAVAASHPRQGLQNWARRWMPWATRKELDRIERKTFWRKYMIGADDCADLIHLTMAERTLLNVHTIGACDLTKEERLASARERKKANDRESKAAQRRAAGKPDRESWLAQSLSATKPWDAEGISRRTWERRQARVASVSRVDMDISAGEQPATSEESAGVARRGGVWGEIPQSGVQGVKPPAFIAPYDADNAPSVIVPVDNPAPRRLKMAHSVMTSEPVYAVGQDRVGNADAGLHGTSEMHLADLAEAA